MEAGWLEAEEIDGLFRQIGTLEELIFEHCARALVQDALDNGRIWPDMAKQILGLFD